MHSNKLWKINRIGEPLKRHTTYQLSDLYSERTCTRKGRLRYTQKYPIHSLPFLHSQCFPKSSPSHQEDLNNLIFPATQHSNIISRNLQFPSHAKTSRPLCAHLNKAGEPQACNDTSDGKNSVLRGASEHGTMSIYWRYVQSSSRIFWGKAVSKLLYYFSYTM